MTENTNGTTKNIRLRERPPQRVRRPAVAVEPDALPQGILDDGIELSRGEAVAVIGAAALAGGIAGAAIF